MSSKKVYEKARVKLLDKNTGEVLKEVDPFTSADAVDYKDDKNVFQELELIEQFKETTTESITNINNKNTEQDKSINNIILKNDSQDETMKNLGDSITDNANEIIKVKEIVNNHSIIINDTSDETVLYCRASSPSANTYVLTSRKGNFELLEGRGVRFMVPADSTGPCTVNVDNTGVVKIKKANKNDANNLKEDSIVTIIYNGENFFLQGDNSSGTALASDIIANKTASTDAGDIVGTMIDHKEQSATLDCGKSVTFTEGHYDKVKVTANSLASQTSATATAAQIESGATAFVNGTKITGTAQIVKSGTIIDIGDTNLSEVEINIAGAVLKDTSTSSTRDTSIERLKMINENKAYLLTDYRDTGASWNTDNYFVVSIDPASKTVINIGNNIGTEVSITRYSSTDFYRINDRYLLSSSHGYSKSGDSRNDNKICLFDTNTDKVIWTQTPSFYRSLTPDKSPLSYDGNMIAVYGNYKDNYRLYRYAINSSSTSETWSVSSMKDSMNATFFFTVNGKNYFVFGTSQAAGKYYFTTSTSISYSSLTNSNMVTLYSQLYQCGPDTAYGVRGSIIELLQFYETSDNVLSFRVLKTIKNFNNGTITFLRKNNNTYIFGNGAYAIDLDASGNIQRDYKNAYATNPNYLEPFLYNCKSLSSGTYQIVKSPTNITIK